MPNVYKKGEPHAPVTTVTGHFNGMHPTLLRDRAAVWYRGDDWDATIASQRPNIFIPAGTFTEDDMKTMVPKIAFDNAQASILMLEAQVAGLSAQLSKKGKK